MVYSNDDIKLNFLIYDDRGRLVSIWNEFVHKGVEQFEFNTNSLSDGLYTLQITTPKSETTQKQFIINPD